jgi:hypothetical protein
MLLYLDMCCLKRPFDDQSHPRIFHAASAEAAGADALATCDDRLIAAARRAGSLIRVRVAGVLELAAEVLS